MEQIEHAVADIEAMGPRTEAKRRTYMPHGPRCESRRSAKFVVGGRCGYNAGHDGKHGFGAVEWTDSEAEAVAPVPVG